MSKRAKATMGGAVAAVEVPAASMRAGGHPEPYRRGPGGVARLLGWQNRAMAAFADAVLMLLIAPTGSGKSTMATMLVAKRLLENPRLRAVVIVPERSGMRSFDDRRMVVGNDVVEFMAGLRIDDGARCVERLIDFVTTPVAAGATLSERVCLCTRLTAVIAHQKMLAGAADGYSPWTDVMVVFDEVHHGRAHDDGEASTTNCGGDLILHFMDRRPGPFVAITATFGRGDRYDVLPRARYDEFTRFVLPFPEYLDSMQHLRTLRMSYLVGTPEEALLATLSVGPRKGIVWVPGVFHAETRKHGSKYNALAAYTRQIGPMVSEDWWTETYLYTPPTGQPRKVRVLDLVSETGRADREEAFDDAIRAGQPTPDVIFALNKLREGFDWPEAEFALAMCEVRSPYDIAQRMGRVTRDYKGKTSATLYMALPQPVDAKAALDHVKTLCVALVAEALWDWPYAPRLSPPAGGARSRALGPSVGEIVAASPDRLQRAVEAVVETYVRDPTAPQRTEEAVVLAACADAGLPVDGDDGAEVVAHVRKLLRKVGRLGRAIAERRAPGLLAAKDLPDVDVEIEESILDGLTTIVASITGATLAKFRDAIGARTAWLPLERFREAIQGMSSNEYTARRREMPGCPEMTSLPRIYGKTFLEIRDGTCDPHRRRAINVKWAPEEEVRARVSGMTTADYARARHDLGDNFPEEGEFKRIYGKTFAELRDGREHVVRPKRARASSYVDETTLRAKSQGMTIDEYDRVRGTWGPEWPHRSIMPRLYGKTFHEVKTGVPGKNRAWVSEDELRDRIQGMSIAGYMAARKAWGPLYPPETSFQSCYGKTFCEIRDGAVGYNRQYTHYGHTAGIAEWAARLGISEGTLRARLRNGWSFSDAVTTPVAPSSADGKRGGGSQPRAISDDRIREMRALYSLPLAKGQLHAVAQQFGVSKTLVRMILARTYRANA